jgi:phthalate 4,5-dioxygenase
MLSPQENEILCRVGLGTPMGEALRRFWVPACLSEELASPDSGPIRLRILGEDLVAFRDSKGRVGVVEAYCPHKLANLYWGRVENCALSCAYHGWTFDADGNCLATPNEPDHAEMRRKIRLTAYPTREAGGMVWAFMGPRERMPELPGLEWAQVPPDHVHLSRWLQRTNWVQGMEGELDSSHISFLHRSFNPGADGPTIGTSRPPTSVWDQSPTLTLRETPYGFVYGARRRAAESAYYWRTTHYLMPYYSLIANDKFPRSGRAWVPVDDYHCMTFSFNFHGERALTAEERRIIESGRGFPPRMTRGAFELPDGYVIDTFLPQANKGNDYLIDRFQQRSRNFTGIEGINEQDRAIQESMRGVSGVGPGKLVDRSREHLGPADVPVITMRKLLLSMAKALTQGIEPTQPANPEHYRVRGESAVVPCEDFDTFLRYIEQQPAASLIEHPAPA